jgi:hypothetical protein
VPWTAWPGRGGDTLDAGVRAFDLGDIVILN